MTAVSTDEDFLRLFGFDDSSLGPLAHPLNFHIRRQIVKGAQRRIGHGVDEVGERDGKPIVFSEGADCNPVNRSVFPRASVRRDDFGRTGMSQRNGF